MSANQFLSRQVNILLRLMRRRICGKIYLLGIDREVSHLEDEVGPDDVEDEED